MVGWSGLRSDHVKHWSEGGKTNLENAILLCGSHHRTLHEGGFKIKRNFEGDWYFTRPDGRPLPQGANYSEDASREVCFDDQISEPTVVYLVPNELSGVRFASG